MLPRSKETPGTFRTGPAPGPRPRTGATVRTLAAAAGLGALLAASGCGGGASPDGPPPASLAPWVEMKELPARTPSEALTLEIARAPLATLVPYLAHPDAAERRIAVRAVGRLGAGDDGAQAAAQLLRDTDPAVREEAAFAVGLSGSTLAANLLGPLLEGTPSPAEVRAAAMGLAHCGDDAAGATLLSLCLRDDLPEDAPEALFRHVRWRNRPWTGALPDERLLRYADHRTPRGRAGLGWIGRIWRDARLLPALERLVRDPSADVRRAAAMGLGQGRPKEERRAEDAARAIAALRPLAGDADVNVVVSACRALASYDVPDAVETVSGLTSHASFLVRTAAAEGLGARKATAALDALAKLAQSDPSPSVRYAAANAVAAIDPLRARPLADDLMKDASDFVRTAAAEILAASAEEWAPDLLAKMAREDTSLRVKAAALEGMKEKTSAAAFEAVRAAIRGDDPALCGVAADVASTNEWKDLLPDIRAALARFPGTKGADAREGIVAALARSIDPEDAGRVERIASDDPDPGPRSAARAALAEKAGRPAPAVDRRPRAEGPDLPLGAVLLGRDVDLIVETDRGSFRIRLDAGNAPIHAAHLADLARKGFYDGLSWHRVVPDFVVQGGCPRGDGSGNAGVNLPLEPTRTPFERGTLGMPRSGHPDTGGAQLFICHSRAPHLDVEYSAIGRVVEGLDVIDRIDVGARIVRVRVAEAK